MDDELDQAVGQFIILRFFLKNWNRDGLNQALGQNFDQIRIFLKFGILMEWNKDKTNLMKSFFFFFFKWHFDGLDQALG